MLVTTKADRNCYECLDDDDDAYDIIVTTSNCTNAGSEPPAMSPKINFTNAGFEPLTFSPKSTRYKFGI